jgi:hypothetical protein
MFVIMSELELFLLTRVLTQNFNTMDLVKFLEKKSKNSHLDHNGHIEGDIIQNHEQKKKSEKSEKPRFYGQNKLLLEHPAFQPLESFSHMATCRSSLENTRKMSLIPIFNKNLPRAHMELGLDVLGIHGKLMKYVVHSSKRKKLKKKLFYFTQVVQTTINQFLVSRNFRG